MLKFKVTNRNRGVDVKTLQVTNVERHDDTTFDISDGDYGVITEFVDEMTYKFWVKDLFTIQEDSHITTISNVNVSCDEDGTQRKYKYVDDVVVNSVSTADSCLTFNVKKEIPLDTTHIYIETRYNAIMFIENNWQMFKVDRKWIDDHSYDYKCVKVETDYAAYGRNKRNTIEGDSEVSDNSVFYYENESWNVINLIGDNLEGCLSGGTINFGSFNKYDSGNDRKAIEMDIDKIYYTREDYIIFDSYPTHYFGEPHKEYDITDNGFIAETTSTAYGKDVVKSIDYPFVYICIEKKEESTGIPYFMKVKQECHIENDVRLSFNYDNLKNSKELSEEDVKLFEEKIFPYGYEINPLSGDIYFQDGMLGGIEFKRDNIMYDEKYVSYDLIYDTAVNVVQIPFSQKFENDMFHNDMLQTHFVEKTKQSLINPIIDMEKDVYLPAIQEKIGEQINAKYKDCYKIIFNLHFREHRDTMVDGNKEEWKCDRDCYWNGTRTLEREYKDEDGNPMVKKIVDLKGRVYNYNIENEEFSKKNKYDYFSYYGEAPAEPNSEEDDEYDNPNTDKGKKPKDYVIEQDNLKNYQELREKRNKLTEYQSDLLSYLGFSNNDVKYQKSKLKKSFLRISFYDSDNIANQNLLHTSTIFLDSGNLFAKYIKNIETEDEYKVVNGFVVQVKDTNARGSKPKWKDSNPKITYKSGDIISKSEFEKLNIEQQKLCVINGEPLAITGGSFSEEEQYTTYDKIGLRVNREPMRKNPISKDDGDFGDNIDELERLRMSSQIVVTDKYSSNHSSEGFYFYNYKSNDNGVFPSDIYMRVEFNHAGYGRTIPFMMPYIRKSEEELKDIDPGYERYAQTPREDKIKTFDDICYDWSEIDFDKGIEGKDDKNKYLKEENDIGYGTVRYMKYCHIKWKYRYDKRTQKHIYYLDPDVYGKGVTADNKHGHNIILNLYEGKIR